ncbi:TetR/AcrR family transcriptional regulator [Streptomonospora nanhaiensis]|uniref:AcrR family transcriptional regulator n=1 Tax=Streptomonospora nanhaiensis TaxID=1323731 RepID=A0A853BJ95_9ACTN|nr:TetR/AcrR family transcriptional regulator [Streptomonospora nanhaiensis]MBV2365631.1 TetR/AcrR family transcriptional regulator [Streptomonospora nanhaiensis]MBX9389045.1 TetR/AcrR family transcriptional regulator [Streptomonospora nanhaiensis]NYI95529.1 AcrR family transcriptional regulator [Streptomonospora nanhaiensis]
MRPEDSQGGQRKRSFIEEARRAQIIEAAIQTIADVGFTNASLARIAERAGISKGVISYHFSSKDELMEQVVIQVYTSIAEHVGPRITAAPDARAGLRAHIRTVAEYMRGHREQLLALGAIFTHSLTPEGRAKYGVAGSEPVYEAIESLFRNGQEAGLFRPFDPRVMAVTVQAGIDGMFGYWAAYPDHDLERHAEELAEAMDRATRAEPAPAP